MKNTKTKKPYMHYLPLIILTVVGAVGGYVYYRLVGCVSGTCAISSNPVISTLYGGLIGALLGFIVTPSGGKGGCCPFSSDNSCDSQDD